MKLSTPDALSILAVLACRPDHQTTAFHFPLRHHPAQSSLSHLASKYSPCCSRSRRLRHNHSSSKCDESFPSILPPSSASREEPMENTRRKALIRFASSLIVASSTFFHSSFDKNNAIAAEFPTAFSESPVSEGVVARVGDRMDQRAYDENSLLQQLMQQEEASMQPFPSIDRDFTSYSSNVQTTTLQNTEYTFYPLESDGPKETNYDQIFTSAFSDAPTSGYYSPQTNAIVSTQLEVLANNPRTSVTVAKQTSVSEQKDLSVEGLLELALGAVIFGGIALTFGGRSRGISSDPGAPAVKVVMVQPEPYGLDQGRNWYNGVDVTVNGPKLANDVRQYCDAGQGVTSECAQSITNYLDTVSTLTPQEKSETASAVISYLDSISSGNNVIGGNFGSTTTSEAFSSYVEGVSSGYVPGPSSAESVANYLDSLANRPVRSMNGPDYTQQAYYNSNGDASVYEKRRTRLSNLEKRLDQLDTSIDRLPDDLSLRLEQWQRTQDERLMCEIEEIVSYLVEERGQNAAPVNGHGMYL